MQKIIDKRWCLSIKHNSLHGQKIKVKAIQKRSLLVRQNLAFWQNYICNEYIYAKINSRNRPKCTLNKTYRCSENSNTFRHLNFKPSGEWQCKAFHKTQVKLFPNVTSICIPFDCLLISWITTTCMIVILTSLLYQDLQSLKA